MACLEFLLAQARLRPGRPRVPALRRPRRSRRGTSCARFSSISASRPSRRAPFRLVRLRWRRASFSTPRP